MISIIVDDRERQVSPHFGTYAVGDRAYQIVNRRLTVGDFAIVYGQTTLILIERKTWKDLNATFLDQSRKLNYLKMIDERKRQFEENGVNVKIFYLLEGPCRGTTVNPRTLMTHVNHLMFDHNIHSITSKSPENSAEVIINLTYDLCTSSTFDNVIAQITKQSSESIGGGDGDVKTGDDVNKSLTVAKEPLLKAMYYSMWHAIEGCTDSMVTALEEEGVMFQFLMLGAYEKKQFACLKRASGAIIPEKQVKKVLESAILPSTHKKVLTCITGVSDTRADLILSKFDMKALLYTATPSDIAELTINGRRLGETLAVRLLTCLRSSKTTI